MFSRKKTSRSRTDSPHVLRSRENARAQEEDNPLARRFLEDDEPDTIDLDDPSRFHSPPDASADSPTTQYFDDEESSPDVLAETNRANVLSRDPETCKFYVNAGQGGFDILLNGRPVLAPTELRPGDWISVGEAEFQFRVEHGRGQSKVPE